MSLDYDFPVNVGPAFDSQGHMVPRAQVVTRTDTNEPLAVVSDRYRLTRHSAVVDEARKFVTAFGEPKENIRLDKNGAVLLATFTFPNETKPVTVGDIAAFRVHVHNTYNARGSISIDIGALILSCLNGMVSSRSHFNFSMRHTRDFQTEFPKPELMLQAFRDDVDVWASLADKPLTIDAAYEVISESVEKGIIPEKAARWIGDRTRPGMQAWDLMQEYTYYNTHESARLSELGRHRRAERITRYLTQKLIGIGDEQRNLH